MEMASIRACQPPAERNRGEEVVSRFGIHNPTTQLLLLLLLLLAIRRLIAMITNITIIAIIAFTAIIAIFTITIFLFKKSTPVRLPLLLLLLNLLGFPAAATMTLSPKPKHETLDPRPKALNPQAMILQT